MTDRRFNSWNWEGPRKGKMVYSWATRFHKFMYWRDKNSRRDNVEQLTPAYRKIVFQLNLEDFNGIKQ